MERKYWRILFVMALLSPLGLLSQGTAWGEWGASDLSEMIGYVPQGIALAETWWQATFPEYTIKVLGDGKSGQAVGYVISALLGSGIIYGLTTLCGKLLGPKGEKTCE